MTVISRRIVYRSLAHILHGQASTVAGRTVARSVKRRGPEHTANALAKEEGRAGQAADLRCQAEELTRRIGDSRYYQGPGLEDAVLGWLNALSVGDMSASWEIARITGIDRAEVAGIDWRDLPVLLERLMPPGVD